MKIISISEIIEVVADMCIETNCVLNEDLLESLHQAVDAEISEDGKRILRLIEENAVLAARDMVPICQDTGMAVLFVKVGQDVRISDGSLTDALNEGVRQGYQNGYLRKSVVHNPIARINTGDNTPAVIHYDIVPGDNLEITLMPKGFGSENMSGIKMLKPADGRKGVVDFVVETITKAGPNPCPPVVVGVGIGGTMEKAALIAKQALGDPIFDTSKDEKIRSMEDEILNKINELGIGPAGLGGKITALGVNIRIYPTHIAGLPVAVNVGCHVTRHRTALL